VKADRTTYEGTTEWPTTATELFTYLQFQTRVWFWYFLAVVWCMTSAAAIPEVQIVKLKILEVGSFIDKGPFPVGVKSWKIVFLGNVQFTPTCSDTFAVGCIV